MGCLKRGLKRVELTKREKRRLVKFPTQGEVKVEIHTEKMICISRIIRLVTVVVQCHGELE